MSLPFYLTFIRIVMSPIFMVLYLYGDAWGLSALPVILLGVVAICEVSDFLDGFVARRYDTVTDMGKVLDPMADSIFRLSVFLSFTQGIVQLPLMLFLVFFLREATINFLRTLCALQGVALGARTSGKVKAVLQASSAFLILILMIPLKAGHISLMFFQQVSLYTMGIVALYTLASGFEYLSANWNLIKKSFAR